MVNVDPWGQKLADQLGRCWRCSLEPERHPGADDDRPDHDVSWSLGEIVRRLDVGVSVSAGRGVQLMNLLEARVLVQQDALGPGAASGSSLKGSPAGRVMLGSDQAMAPAVRAGGLRPHTRRPAMPFGIRPFVKGDLVCVFGCGGDRDGASALRWPQWPSCRIAWWSRRITPHRRSAADPG